MLLALALLAPDPEFAELRARIDRYCEGNAACIEEQKQGVKHYLGMMTLYDPPKEKLESCIASATKEQLTNWKQAADCLRASVRPKP